MTFGMVVSFSACRDDPAFGWVSAESRVGVGKMEVVVGRVDRCLDAVDEEGFAGLSSDRASKNCRCGIGEANVR
jgi:hypothetical protein